MYLFEEGANWDGYRKDTTRGTKPKNYGYQYVSAQLGVEQGMNYAMLEAKKCYIFVVDYTNVGQATQNPNDWRELYFSYYLGGNPNDMVDGAAGEWGVGYPGAAAGLLPLSSLIITLLSLLIAFFSN